MELLEPGLRDLNALVRVLLSLRRVAHFAGIKDNLAHVLWFECVQDGEHVLPIGPAILRKLIREEHHQLLVLLDHGVNPLD